MPADAAVVIATCPDPRRMRRWRRLGAHQDHVGGPIAVIVNGTSSSYSSVPVHWTISSNTTCFDGDDLLVGYEILDMSSDLPDQIGPSWGEYRIPSTAATGPYWLCAGIDAYGTLTESDTSDNIIRSERLVVVVP